MINEKMHSSLSSLVLPELCYYRFGNIPGGDLRISITNQCNMNCYYCHNEGQDRHKKFFMGVSDFGSIVKLGVKFGAYKIRITGGEPLINQDLCQMLYLAKNTAGVRNIGINTNGILLDQSFINIFSNIGLNSLVVGVDCIDSGVSKNSGIGLPSKDILINILNAKCAGINVQIACTFNGKNESAIMDLIHWCYNNSVLLKIIEISNEEIFESTSIEFIELIKSIVQKFKLSLGRTIPFDEYFAVQDNGVKILFFHSHCRVRNCRACANMHMRVIADGNARPCLLRSDTQQNILTGDTELAMCKALHNLGNPPENPPI